MIAVQLSRQHVVDLLRQANLTEMAEAALHDLPDPVDREDVAAWGGRWNIDMDYFINRIGRRLRHRHRRINKPMP